MALDKEFKVEDGFCDKPSRVDGFAERLIISNIQNEAKTKRLNDEIDSYQRRHARFQMLLMALIAGGIYYLYTIGCWEMVKDFFVSMSN